MSRLTLGLPPSSLSSELVPEAPSLPNKRSDNSDLASYPKMSESLVRPTQESCQCYRCSSVGRVHVASALRAM
jgi:hypothetical protein